MSLDSSRPSSMEMRAFWPCLPRRSSCTLALLVEFQTASCFMIANANASGSFPLNLAVPHALIELIC